MSTATLGYELVGSGSRRLIVLNDWFCDTSTWQGAHAYLDQARFSWAFADMRGYGRSRGQSGNFSVVEAASDVLSLADTLGWTHFSIVGHSLSTYVALHLGQHAAARVQRVVLITPGPPRGLGADAAWLENSQAIAGDDARRAELAQARFAARLSPGWGAYKSKRWLATSDAEAAASYVRIFARDGLPTPEATVAVPVLAITGEEDVLVMRKEAVLNNLSPLCPELEVAGLIQCGHYPMQEMPPLTVCLVERFCGA